MESNISEIDPNVHFCARRSTGKILINCPAWNNTARPNRPLSCTLMLAIPPVPTTRRHNIILSTCYPPMRNQQGGLPATWPQDSWHGRSLLLPHDVHYHFHHGLDGTKRVRSRAPKVHPATVARRPTVPSNGTGATTIYIKNTILRSIACLEILWSNHNAAPVVCTLSRRY